MAVAFKNYYFFRKRIVNNAVGVGAANRYSFYYPEGFGIKGKNGVGLAIAYKSAV